MAKGKWQEQNQEILDRLDILREYAELGVHITGSNPNSRGWVSCKSIDKPDQKTESAGINVRSGRYKDHRKDSIQSLKLFEFAIQYGNFATFAEARKHYAEKAGVNLARGRKPKDPETNFDWQEWRDAIGKLYLVKKPGIKLEALKRAGTRRGTYAKRNNVFALPCWGKTGDEEPPTAWLAFDRLGGMIELYQGKNAQGQTLPMRLVKTACPKYADDVVWAGCESLLIENDDVELIIKTEGYSDMLSVMSHIPDDKIGKILVVTNPFGTDEIPNRWQIESVIGKKVVVLHDCDKPGQGIRDGSLSTDLYGAARWADSLATTASEVRNLVLPFPISEDHGKDIRDWFTEGGTWEKFMELVAAAPVVAARKIVASDDIKDEPTGAQAYYNSILDRLGITILGEDDDECIHAFCAHTMKRIRWPNVSKIPYETILQQCGPVADEVVANPHEQTPDDGQVEMREVRRAIAIKSSKTRSMIDDLRGPGIWQGVDENGIAKEDSIVIVAGSEAARLNGKLERVTVPKVDGLILDFVSSHQPWYGSFERLEMLIDRARNDPEWCRATVKNMQQILDKWRWADTHSSTVFAGLILTTWTQTLYPWRPYVAITGRSNAGKTTLFNFLFDVFQGRNFAINTKNTTEAGLRQKISTSAPPVLLDEFERNERTSRILEALRASSRSIGESLRGSTSHKHQSFRYAIQPWMTAINLGITDEADRNRAILGEVCDPQGQQTLRDLPDILARRKMGLELAAISIVYIFKALARYEYLSKMEPPQPDVSRRLVESYAVPASMLSAIYDYSEDDSMDFQNLLLSDLDFDGYNESEEEGLLNHILSAKFKWSRGDECTVAEALMEFGSQGDAMRSGLARHGITKTSIGHKDDKEPHLFISKVGPRSEILRGTNWERGGHISILGRLEDAITNHRVLCSGHYRRGVAIPWRHVEPHIGYTVEEF